MRKISTLLLILCIVLGASAQKKKVGYYGLNKSNSGTAAMDPNAQDDPILKMLQSDANLEVTVNLVPASGDAAPAGWNDFDVVILQESIGSANQMVKDLNINAVSKPYLVNKTYGFKKGSLFTDGTGGGAEGTDVNLQVVAGKETHDIFKAVKINGGQIACFNGTTNDLGADGTKALNHNATVVVGGGALLAQPNGVATTAICVNDIPAGVAIGDHTTKARVITMGMNYGAICKTGNITADGLTIWRNAVYLLAGLAVPSTPASVNAEKINNLSFVRDGNNIQVNFGISQKADVSVYNIAGKLVNKEAVNGTSARISLQSQPKGVYIVNINGNQVRGTQKFIVR
jgi:hypothetical protein